ncbi:MAG: bifunctional UDP-N-acetylmuramoyl-tripeptide:D-alanyl-D-alanine ligase/alanine racemase [Bacteroidales bacterium]|nr:bifunctional UDP-N-acetylmuramoyl-tripeptide:D-alanyl-D-alanine ligase/alanine racemase [Bacteroidales bacterium]
MMYKISKITEIIGAKQIGENDVDIENLLIDSRSVSTVKNTLFVAIKGKRHDGHDFISDLYKRGIKNFIVENLPDNYKELTEANFSLVNDSLVALQHLASYHRKNFLYPVVGITGSNGKTIVKEWLYHILQKEKKIIRSPKSYNSQVGVPLSVWLMQKDFDLAIFEAGISLPDEMSTLQKIIEPNVGLITNIGESHQENFSSIEDKLNEKLKLFINSDCLVYCKDYKLIHEAILRDKVLKSKKTFTWSEKDDAQLQINSIRKLSKTTIIEYLYENKEQDIEIPFSDKASIIDAIHTLALVLALGFQSDSLKEQFLCLPPIAMRMELKKGVNNCTIINDCYSSDLNSLGIALNYLNQQNQHKKKTLILSDIFQSGKSEDELYSEVSALISEFKINRLIGVGKSVLAQADKFSVDKEFFRSTQEFIEKISESYFNNEAILLKGARSFEFEKIAKHIEEKVHRTVLEIDLNSLIYNLNHFKAKLKPQTRIMIMVKALSYGSGTFEIANILQYHGVDYLGVAVVDEGVALRKAGIKIPIIVMNPDSESFDLMLDYKLEPEIYGLKILRQFKIAVSKRGFLSYPIHLKLDTGMHRLGFIADELDILIQELKQSSNIKLASIFSHLAASDEKKHDLFTQEQVKAFDFMSKKIKKEFTYPIIRHILNSAGIERFPEAQFEMVRLGIGLYGISSVNQKDLRVVSTLKSTVLQTKQVSKNETVGYSRKAKIVKDTTIAIIPIGYADGLDRRLGNGVGTLFINGFNVSIIGNICMDMCIVDITGCNIHEGDEVIVFGKDRAVNKLAKQLNTIPYEIFTSISTRVKRVYFHE